MTRTRRALRLSPLAFALAFGAYCENPFPSGRSALAPDLTESSPLPPAESDRERA